MSEPLPLNMCPKCNTPTMEEGIVLTKEEYVRVEDGPFLFKDKLRGFSCSACGFNKFVPKTAA